MRLRSYLLALALVTVLPLLVFSVWMTVSTFYDHLATVKEGLLNSARSVSVAVDRKMLASLSELEHLGTLELTAGADSSRFRERAELVVAREAWSQLTIFTASGDEVLQFGRPPDGTWALNGEKAAFQKAVAAGRPVVSDTVSRGGEGVGLVFVSVPVNGAGQLKEVAVAAFAPTALVEVMGREQLPTHGVAMLIDREKTIIGGL